jgi:hypothetical protein
MVTVTPQPTFRVPVLHIPAHAADALSASVAVQRGSYEKATWLFIAYGRYRDGYDGRMSGFLEESHNCIFGSITSCDKKTY